MIALQAYMKVSPMKRDQFLAQIQEVLSGSRAEEGNIQFDLFEKTEEPNTFVLLERWKDQQAVDFHHETDHFKKFVKSAENFLTVPLEVIHTESTNT